MNILRSERLILVNPDPNLQSQLDKLDKQTFINSERRLVTCAPKAVPQTAAKAWKDGFFPLFAFPYADEIDLWTQDIPLLPRRWAAFGYDEEPERLEWLLQHPAIEVLRGLARRDLLALPDAAFDMALNNWLERDPVAKNLFEQLRDGRIDLNELEAIPTSAEQQAKGYSSARWKLDPRVTLKFNSEPNQIVITAHAEEKELLPKSLGEFGKVKDFNGDKLILQVQADAKLICALKVRIRLPEGIPARSDDGHNASTATEKLSKSNESFLLPAITRQVLVWAEECFLQYQYQFLSPLTAADTAAEKQCIILRHESGECSIHITVDFEDETKRIVFIYFDSTPKEKFEGKTANLYNKDSNIILSKVIRNGIVVERFSADVAISRLIPPFNLTINEA